MQCAPPIPFDIDYTRTLGYSAVRALLSEPESGQLRPDGVVCLDGGKSVILRFSDIRDPKTQRIRIRVVDVDSEKYDVARKYMVRFEPKDLEDPAVKARLAEAAHMSTVDLEAKFRLRRSLD